jgi:Holliday junction resolvasome RuvABC endonuclease subunit
LKILALDQATTTGYAIVENNGKVIESGTRLLADKKRTGESRGMRYIRFRQLLTEIFEKHPDIKIMVHEQTLLRGGAATEIANGFKALILECSEIRHVEVSCVHTSELKFFATGYGKAEKEDMIKACQLHGGVNPGDDNEADAVMIGLWAASKFGTFPAIFTMPEKKPKKKKPVTAKSPKQAEAARSWMDELI